jgi:hypothetical protein
MMKMKAALIIMLLAFSGKAFSWVLEKKSIITGYSACSWVSNGNGTSTLRVNMNYKNATGSSNGGFSTRAVLLYTYDKNGVMKPSSAAAKYVSLGGIKSEYGSNFSGNYVLYTQGSDKYPWNRADAFVAAFEILIDDAVVSDWPGISVQAGNYTSGNDVGEITGGAYLTKDMASQCKVIDPIKPPPPEIVISLSAPDKWDLGELPQGDGEKLMGNDPLCFFHASGETLNGLNFVIDASNEKGRDGATAKYRLQHLTKPDQFVPYDVKLEGGTNTVILPNTTSVPVQFSSTGRTCFTPTFRTTVGKSVKGGDYSDTLTFTVVTKS